jgi:hypothetical protein
MSITPPALTLRVFLQRTSEKSEEEKVKENNI